MPWIPTTEDSTYWTYSKGLRKKYLLRVSRVIFKKAEKIPMKPEDSSKANIVAPENGWLED